jgi:methylthioribose-1-phosphate isomerase
VEADFMKINDDTCQSIRFDENTQELSIIDQTLLPHQLSQLTLESLDAVCHAIISMQVRGAPLIGITAAFGVYLALRDQPGQLDSSCQRLLQTRPTAVNLQWALQRVHSSVFEVARDEQAQAALTVARQLLAEDAASCSAIGDHGLQVLERIWQRKQQSHTDPQQPPVLNVLTHCNAGWLATADWGTALAPIYKAHLRGIPIHVWVDETRPRNQGAALTAWELKQQGVAHTVIVDNAGGHLMQHDLVDVCLVGSDRTTASGDVCNKIGTYLKALAAHDNNIPFYAALPVSTVDFNLHDGVRDIPIEERHGEEVSHLAGLDSEGVRRKIQVTPADTRISNFGFDVTPARLITGLITELGIFPATPTGLQALRKLVEQPVSKQQDQPGGQLI